MQRADADLAEPASGVRGTCAIRDCYTHQVNLYNGQVMNNAQSIRAQLADTFVTSEAGSRLRKQLAMMAEENYVAQHAPQEYLAFLGRHEGKFKRVGPQETNFPYVWQFFSCVSQHVYGDCIEECLDKAMELEQNAKASSFYASPAVLEKVSTILNDAIYGTRN
jgi:hypothetical protein